MSEKGQGNAVTKLLQEGNDETNKSNNAANNATDDKSKLSSPPPAAHVVYALENKCEVVSKLLQILESISSSNKKEG